MSVFFEKQRIVSDVTIAQSGLYANGDTGIPVSEATIDIEMVTSITMVQDTGEEVIFNFSVPAPIGTLALSFRTVGSTVISNNLLTANANLNAASNVWD